MSSQVTHAYVVPVRCCLTGEFVHRKMPPTTTKRWTLEGKTGFDSLHYYLRAPMPHLGERDFGEAAVARILAITSSASKAQMLKSLGADHIINYNAKPDWDAAATDLSFDGLGVNHIIDVGGPRAMAQSLKAIGVYACMSINGSLVGHQQKSSRLPWSA
ncbi:MAG: hypothetical protein Q9188_005500 [Gyalolechia gomerana]